MNRCFPIADSWKEADDLIMGRSIFGLTEVRLFPLTTTEYFLSQIQKVRQRLNR